MIGGHAVNWEGTADNQTVRAGATDVLSAAYIMGLNANPSQAGKDAAEKAVELYINGNDSNSFTSDDG